MTPEERGNATHAYAGYCKECGAMTAAAVDYPSDVKETAGFVARILRSGRRVERVEIEVVRKTLAFCSCTKKRKPKAQPSLFAEGAA